MDAPKAPWPSATQDLISRMHATGQRFLIGGEFALAAYGSAAAAQYLEQRNQGWLFVDRSDVWIPFFENEGWLLIDTEIAEDEFVDRFAKPGSRTEQRGVPGVAYVINVKNFAALASKASRRRVSGIECLLVDKGFLDRSLGPVLRDRSVAVAEGIFNKTPSEPPAVDAGEDRRVLRHFVIAADARFRDGDVLAKQVAQMQADLSALVATPMIGLN